MGAEFGDKNIGRKKKGGRVEGSVFNSFDVFFLYIINSNKKSIIIRTVDYFKSSQDH